MFNLLWDGSGRTHRNIRKYRSLSTSCVTRANLTPSTILMTQFFLDSASSSSSAIYYCHFHYRFFLRCLCTLYLLVFKVDYFSERLIFRLPTKKVLSKLEIYQPEERTLGGQSCQLKPLHRQLAPFVSTDMIKKIL